MGKLLFQTYNSIRNEIYNIKPILTVYSFFKSYIPDKVAAKKLKKYGYKDLDTLFEALNKHNYMCFCDFGTLLGFVRGDSFIPHDNDIDIGICAHYPFDWNTFEKVLIMVGLRLRHYYIFNGKITEQTYSFSDGVSVDFFLYEDQLNGKMRTYVYYRDHNIIYDNVKQRSVKALTYPMVDHIESMYIHGIHVNVPCNPETRLETIYGKTWKIPDPDYVADRKNDIMSGFGEKYSV